MAQKYSKLVTHQAKWRNFEFLVATPKRVQQRLGVSAGEIKPAQVKITTW
jgi:hypothetical protein